MYVLGLSMSRVWIFSYYLDSLLSCLFLSLSLALALSLNPSPFQVTEGKQELERASQLARKMKKEAASLSEWLSVTEAELVQKSTSEGLLGDLDIEISWAKVSCSSGYLPVLCQGHL